MALVQTCICHLNRTEYGIEMRAVMDDKNKATMALFVDSSGHNIFLGPDPHFGCDFDVCTIWEDVSFVNNDLASECTVTEMSTIRCNITWLQIRKN